MTTLFENPMPIIYVGIFVVAILGAILLNTRRGVLLIPIGLVLVLILLGVLVERLVVTPREEVEMTIDGLAAAIKANDPAGTLRYISPSAEKTRRRAEWGLERFAVKDAKVRNLEITVNRLTSPPSAKASFNGILSIEDRKGQLPYRAYPIEFTAEFRKEGNRWLLMGHTEDTPDIGP